MTCGTTFSTWGCRCSSKTKNLCWTIVSLIRPSSHDEKSAWRLEKHSVIEIVLCRNWHSSNRISRFSSRNAAISGSRSTITSSLTWLIWGACSSMKIPRLSQRSQTTLVQWQMKFYGNRDSMSITNSYWMKNKRGQPSISSWETTWRHRARSCCWRLRTMRLAMKSVRRLRWIFHIRFGNTSREIQMNAPFLWSCRTMILRQL